MRACFLHDKDGKLLLWLRAESFIEHDSLAKFAEQSNGDAKINYQKNGDKLVSVYIESASETEKPKPFWKKWHKKK